MTTNTAHSLGKSCGIANLSAEVSLARVEAECLFVYIAEQVIRFTET